MPSIVDTNLSGQANWRFVDSGETVSVHVNGPVRVNSPLSARRGAGRPWDCLVSRLPRQSDDQGVWCGCLRRLHAAGGEPPCGVSPPAASGGEGEGFDRSPSWTGSRNIRLSKTPFSLALLLGLAAVQPALAHPHIFVDARAAIFDDAGQIVSVRAIAGRSTRPIRPRAVRWPRYQSRREPEPRRAAAAGRRQHAGT